MCIFLGKQNNNTDNSEKINFYISKLLSIMTPIESFKKVKCMR